MRHMIMNVIRDVLPWLHGHIRKRRTRLCGEAVISESWIFGKGSIRQKWLWYFLGRYNLTRECCLRIFCAAMRFK
jgi:hypothetical protein